MSRTPCDSSYWRCPTLNNRSSPSISGKRPSKARSFRQTGCSGASALLVRCSRIVTDRCSDLSWMSLQTYRPATYLVQMKRRLRIRLFSLGCAVWRHHRRMGRLGCPVLTKQRWNCQRQVLSQYECPFVLAWAWQVFTCLLRRSASPTSSFDGTLSSLSPLAKVNSLYFEAWSGWCLCFSKWFSFCSLEWSLKVLVSLSDYDVLAACFVESRPALSWLDVIKYDDEGHTLKRIVALLSNERLAVDQSIFLLNWQAC